MSGFGHLVPITPEIRARARELLYPGGSPGNNLGREAEVAGAFGEAAFETAWRRLGGRDLVHVGTFDHDYRHEAVGRLEVKTKPRSVRPRAEYQASVSLENLELQTPEAWIFASLYPKADAPYFRYEEAWIVGWLWDAEFRERSYLVPRGSEMGDGTPSFRDMRDIDLANLRPLEDLVRRSISRDSALHAVTNPLRVTEEMRDKR